MERQFVNAPRGALAGGETDTKSSGQRAPRVGIVGAGVISDHYLKISKSFTSFDVVAVADLDPMRAAAKAEAHGVSAASVDELLSDASLDAIVNLTVPAAHAAVSLAAIEAGKHVYSEKPLATGRAAAAAVLASAADKGLRVGCAPDTFLGAGLQTAREVLDSGLIGEPIAATAFMMSSGPERWHPDPAFFYAPGAGPLFDMGPYYLTALVNLFGPIGRVTGSATVGRDPRVVLSSARRGQTVPVGTPTHISAQLEFVSGPVATLVTSFDAPASELPWCEVYGTEATLSLPDPNRFGGPLRVRRPGDEAWETLPLTRRYAENSRGLGLADMIVSLRDGRPHRASGELAYHVLDAMQGVLEAASTHSWLTLESSCERPAPLPEAVAH